MGDVGQKWNKRSYNRGYFTVSGLSGSPIILQFTILAKKKKSVLHFRTLPKNRDISGEVVKIKNTCHCVHTNSLLFLFQYCEIILLQITFNFNKHITFKSILKTPPSV